MDDLIREMLEPERPAPGMVARRRRLTATTAIIGLAAIGVTSLTTNALFTDLDDDGNSSGFVAGSINIAATPTNFNVAAGNAAPGDHYYTAIQVRNEGSLELRYAFSIVGDEESDANLLSVLDYSIFYGGTPETCAARNGNEPTGSPYTGTLGTTSHWIGVDAVGEAPATNDRTLTAKDTTGDSEYICLGLSFHEEATNAVQLARAGVDFAFHAVQVANNP